MNEQIRKIIDEMAQVALLDKNFADSFYDRIMKDEAILKEFITYLQTQKFICETKVEGYSIVDVLVWQMDHFKAFLDRGEDVIKYNECEMILKAFDTFLKMKEDPRKYVRMMSEESGSDYDGKF